MKIPHKYHKALKILGVGTMLIIFLALSLLSVQHQTLTYDEIDHYRYGKQILELNSDRFDDSKMPFSALNALPAKAAVLLPPSWLRTYLEQITTGRLVTILFSMLIAFFVFQWSKALYGFVAGFFPLFLYTLEPNIIAHSQLITTDIYATGMITLSIYTLWLFRHHRDTKHAFWLAVTLSLSQLAKYTCIFLYPIMVILLLLSDTPDLFRMVSEKNTRGLWDYIRRMLLYAVFVVAISLMIINAGFLFNGTFTAFRDYTFNSDLFQIAQIKFKGMGGFAIPLPYPYLQGLDLVRYYERTGKHMADIYLFGELKKGGFPGYYLYASLYKVPIAIQLALIFSAIAYSWKGKERRFLENELFLIGPAIFFLIYFNYFFKAQIGIRFFLVVFPFVHIFCGNLLQGWQLFKPSRLIAAGALSTYLIISVLSYYPHYIPYVNELILDRRLAYRVLADSNLDWGHSGWFLEKYVAEHPDTIVNPRKPVAGRIVVGVNSLLGINEKPKRYRWLREHFEPIDTVAYSYLVFEITPEQFENLR